MRLLLNEMDIMLTMMNTLNMKQIHKTRAKAKKMQKLRNGKIH